jgi:hypothetical protein
MSRPVRLHRNPRIPTLILVAVPLLLIALAIGVATSQLQASATMPPPEQATVPHFVDVKAPGEPRTVVVGGMMDLAAGDEQCGWLSDDQSSRWSDSRGGDYCDRAHRHELCAGR